MRRISAIISGFGTGSNRDLVPACFLLAAVASAGLRSPASWTLFSGALLAYLAFFEKGFAFSRTGLWGAFILWLAAGLAFSPEPLNSLAVFSRYASLLAFFVLARRSGERAADFWIGAVFALACVAGPVILLQNLAPERVPAALKGMSGIIGPNVNYSAAFAAAAFAGGTALLSSPGSVRARALCASLTVFLGVVLVVAHARGALLGAAAGTLSVFLFKRSARPLAWSVAGALLLLVLLPQKELNWLLKLYDPNVFGRTRIWESALRAAAERPVFGFGLGLFERAFELFKFPFYNGISYYGHATLNAHSEPLNLAAEAGIPAAALFVGAWGAAVFGSAANTGRALALKAFAVSLFVQAAADMIFYSGAVQLLFWGTLGMLAADTAEADVNGRPWFRRFSLLLLAGCWGAAALTGQVSGRYRSCAFDDGLGASDRQACLEKAALISPGDTALAELTAPVYMTAHGNPAMALARLRGAIEAAPFDPFRYFEAAELYRAAGDPDSARRMLAKAISLEPDFLRARLAMARLEDATGRCGTARAQLAKVRGTLERRPSNTLPSSYDLALLALPGTEYEKLRKEACRKR